GQRKPPSRRLPRNPQKSAPAAAANPHLAEVSKSRHFVDKISSHVEDITLRLSEGSRNEKRYGTSRKRNTEPVQRFSHRHLRAQLRHMPWRAARLCQASQSGSETPLASRR